MRKGRVPRQSGKNLWTPTLLNKTIQWRELVYFAPVSTRFTRVMVKTNPIGEHEIQVEIVGKDETRKLDRIKTQPDGTLIWDCDLVVSSGDQIYAESDCPGGVHISALAWVR